MNDSVINFTCEVRGAHMRRPAAEPLPKRFRQSIRPVHAVRGIRSHFRFGEKGHREGWSKLSQDRGAYLPALARD
jgi:hypothetical protein